MKTVLALVVFGCVASLVDAAILKSETKMTLATKGSIILKAGAEVDVVSDDGVVATVIYRKIQGSIPLAALSDTPPPVAASEPAEELPASIHSAPNEILAGQIRAATEKLTPVMVTAEALQIQGRMDEGNALIQATFPAATRTPAEKLVLANVLFPALPKLSYSLHQQAAAALPDSPDAMLEWAMEQHRAREYAGAAQTYATYSQWRPTDTSAYGLAAECALRTGNLPAAVALWQKLEGSSERTFERFESLVCDVNGGLHPDLDRNRLLHRVEKGEELAAEELLSLDMSWSKDWWNASPSPERLAHDLGVVKQKFPQPKPGLRAAICTGECAVGMRDGGSVNLRAKLGAAGFLFDAKQTLPRNGKALSQMLYLCVEEHRALTHDQAQSQFGSRILALARETKDPEIYYAVMYLYQDSVAVVDPEGAAMLATIVQAGWDDTHDARFAFARLAGLDEVHKLTMAEPVLHQALKAFPENAEIANRMVMLEAAKFMEQDKLHPNAADSGALKRAVVAGIKAEFMKFSSQHHSYVFPRPSAFTLRTYFGICQSLQENKPMSGS